MQAADHLPNLFDRDVAREFLGLVFRLAGEAQDLGMVARVDQSRRRIVAAIVEWGRLSFAAAPMRDEKARDPLGKGALPHPPRPGQQPGVMDAAALPRFEKGGFRSEEHTSELQSLMRISYA